MTTTNSGEVTKPGALAHFARTWLGWPRSLPIILLLGAALLWTATRLFPLPSDASPAFRDALHALGNVVLTGAVANGFVKSFQFTNVFRDELRKVIAEERHSGDVWTAATAELVRRCCSQGSEGIIRTLRYYIGLDDVTVRDAHYANCRWSFEIDWVDEAAGTFVIQEVAAHDVASNVGKSQVSTKYNWQGDPGETLEIQQLDVAGESRLLDVSHTPGNVRYQLRLSGAESYRIFRRTLRHGSIYGQAPYVHFAFERFACRVELELRVKNSTIHAKAVVMGTNKGFTDLSGGSFTREEPFFPKQGFMLLLTRRSPLAVAPPPGVTV